MGLLDWLTDSIGSGAGAGANSMAIGDQSTPPPPQPAPNVPLPPARPQAAGPGAVAPPPPPPGSGIPPDTSGGQGFAPPPMPPGPPPGPPPEMGQDQMGAPTGFPTPPPPVAPPPGPPGSGIPPDTSGGQGLNVPPVPGAPPPVRPGGIGSDAARAPNQPPLPPVPMPMARPPGAGPGANQLGQRTVPPAATPTGGATPDQQQAVASQAIQQKGQEINWLGKLMGAKTPEENKKVTSEILRGMAAGLKDIGAPTGMGKFASFAHGAGAGMTGVFAERDRVEESQRKHIAQKILANNSAMTGQLNVARTQLALAQAQDAYLGRGNKNDSPYQLYLRAQAAVGKDDIVRSARDEKLALMKDQKMGPDHPQVKAADAKLQKAIEERNAVHMRAVGLDPSLGASIAKVGGMSAESALSGDKLNQQTYDNLPVGGYFIDPQTKKMMRKPPAPGAPALAPAGAGAAPAAPPARPAAPVTAPAGSRAAMEDDTEEEVG